MEQLRNNIKLLPVIPPKAYGVTTNGRPIDMRGLVAAYNTLFIGTNPTDADTIVVGSRTYTFQSSLTNVDGHVKIGASVAATQVNLVHAVMLNGGTSGTDYAAAMTQNADVTISEFGTPNAANTAVVTAKQVGIAGNSIATTDTLTAAADGFSSATLVNGRDGEDSQSALILVNVGDITGAPTSVKVKIQEADDAGFVTSPTTALGGDEVTVTRNSSFHFEVSNAKRYLRAVITIAGGSTPTANISASAILSTLAVPFPVVLEVVA